MLSPKVLRLHHDGSLVEHRKTVESLPIGCIMHYASGRGDYVGCVVGSKDNFGRQRVIYETERGFVENYIQLVTTEPISERFGIGQYFNDEMKTMSASEIEHFEKMFIVDTDKRNQEKIALEKKNAEISEGLKIEYDYLTVLVDYYNQNETKKNLVKMLKKAFPKTKFSVRKRHYNSYSIEWTDGASKDAVNEIAEMFNGYTFDHHTDYRDHTPSLFNNLFGSFEYIGLTRNYSEPIQSLRSEIKDFVTEYSDRSWDSGSIAFQVHNNLFNGFDLTDVTSDLKIIYPDPKGCDIVSAYKLEII